MNSFTYWIIYIIRFALWLTYLASNLIIIWVRMDEYYNPLHQYFFLGTKKSHRDAQDKIYKIFNKNVSLWKKYEIEIIVPKCFHWFAYLLIVKHMGRLYVILTVCIFLTVVFLTVVETTFTFTACITIVVAEKQKVKENVFCLMLLIVFYFRSQEEPLCLTSKCLYF